MSFAQVKNIIKDLKADKIKPVYFLHGEEPYFIDTLAHYFEEHLVPPEQRDFNQDIIYGQDIEMDKLRNILRQYPMMFNFRLVILKEAQNFQRLKENLDPYIDSPSSTTILVVCYKYKEIKDKAFIKKVQLHGLWFDSKTPYPREIDGWILEQVQQAGFTIQDKARHMLLEYLGADLGKVANELSKLFVAVEKGKEINARHIEEIVGISREYNVFELQDALAARDRSKVMRIIFYMAENEKEQPLPMLLSVLFGFYSKVLAVQYLKERNPESIKTALNMNWGAERFELAARMYTPAKVVEILRMMRQLDRKSKGLDNVSASNGEMLKELSFFMLN